VVTFSMRNQLIFAMVLTLSATSVFVTPARTQELNPSGNYFARLDGPTGRCAVPSRFLFVTSDAITAGKVTFRGRSYTPRGRLQPETRLANIRLILRADDPKPLVTLTATVDGSWNGSWTGQKPGCTGKVRIQPR
jgi:hypothetical protein